MTPRPLRILFVVDFRSGIARGWIDHLASCGHEVLVVSSYPHHAPVPTAYTVQSVNLGFSQFASARLPAHRADERPDWFRRGLSRALSTPAVRRAWHATNSSVIALDARRHAPRVNRLISEFQPDLIHAMRIPYESVLAAHLRTSAPLVVSTWGNDLTLWAAKRRRMASLTRRVLRGAAGLHCDCHRDVSLAQRYGFPPERPTAVLPGGGGVDGSVFHAGPADAKDLERFDIPHGRPVVVNPRAIREYVRNDCFLRAWSQVLRVHPDACAVCVGMAGDRKVERLCDDLGIRASVRLLPLLPPNVLAHLLRTAKLAVSPSTHDGTPNTLLEAMASGCLPVVGDIDSIREWIEDGVNGLLCDPTSEASIARAILNGLADNTLQLRAARHNQQIIAARAERQAVMQEAVAFYREVIDRHAGDGQNGR